MVSYEGNQRETEKMIKETSDIYKQSIERAKAVEQINMLAYTRLKKEISKFSI